MTVMNRGSLDGSDLQNKKIGVRKDDLDLASPELGRYYVAGGSDPEEGIERRRKNQVMRIREEDLLIGFEKIIGCQNRKLAPLFFFSRPCSPLSGIASRRQEIALN